MIAQSSNESGNAQTRKANKKEAEAKKVLSDDEAEHDHGRDSKAEIRRLPPLCHKDLKLPEFRDAVFQKVDYLLNEPKKQNEFLDLVDGIKKRQSSSKRGKLIENARRRQ